MTFPTPFLLIISNNGSPPFSSLSLPPLTPLLLLIPPPPPPFPSPPRIEEIETLGGNPHVAKILVGNKCDLGSEDRVITAAMGEEFADKEMPFLETSAKEDVRVGECFELLAREILRKFVIFYFLFYFFVYGGVFSSDVNWILFSRITLFFPLSISFPSPASIPSLPFLAGIKESRTNQK